MSRKSADALWVAEAENDCQARSLASELATVLLEANFNEDQVADLLTKLDDHGYDSDDVIKCMLSRFAFHIALGCDDGCYDRWNRALRRLNAPILVIDQTVQEAEELKTSLVGKGRDEISQAVYKKYFGLPDPLDVYRRAEAVPA